MRFSPKLYALAILIVAQFTCSSSQAFLWWKKPKGPKRVICTIKLDDDDDFNGLKKRIKASRSEDVELVELAPKVDKKHPLKPDWFDDLCKRTDLHCDSLAISGHFNSGFMGRSGVGLSLETLEKNSCKAKEDPKYCGALFADPSELFLLDPLAASAAAADKQAKMNSVRNLKGYPSDVASKISKIENMTLDEGGMDRIQNIFSGVDSVQDFHAKTNDTVDHQMDQWFAKQVDPSRILASVNPQSAISCEADAAAADRPAPKKLRSNPISCELFGDKLTEAQKLEKVRAMLTDKDQDLSKLALAKSLIDSPWPGSVRAINHPCDGIAEHDLVGPIQQSGKWVCADPSRAMFGEPEKAHACCLIQATTLEEKIAIANKKASAATLAKEKSSLDEVTVRNWQVPEQTNSGADQTLKDDKLGNVVRFSTWNIARGAEFDSLKKSLGDCAEYMRAADKPIKDQKKWQKAYDQTCGLAGTDVFELQEVDMNVCRSGYRNVAEELAKNNGLNYAWTAEFDEIDPRKTGLKEDQEYKNCRSPDAKKSKNLIGNAIMSRYPIKSATKIPLVNCHDWSKDEAQKKNLIEFAKGKGMRYAFDENDQSQIRTGQRNALVAEIDSPKGPVTVVSVHLENKASPKCRQAQMLQIGEVLKNIKTPIVLAGDLNTTGLDGRPQSYMDLVKAQLTPKNLFKQMLNRLVNPFSSITGPAIAVANNLKVTKNPTSRGIPIFAENPEAKMGKILKDEMHCQSGGNAEYTLSGKSAGTFGETNERSKFGYTYTAESPKTYGPVGKQVLDWNCVIGNGNSDFIGARGETYSGVNSAMEDAPADHFAKKVDIVIQPSKSLKNEAKADAATRAPEITDEQAQSLIDQL